MIPLPKTKVTYIISNINKALAFEWIASHLDKKFLLNFIILNPADSVLENFLVEIGVPVKRITYLGKKDVPRAIAQVLAYLYKTKPDIVHAHLFDACIVGLVSAKLLGIKKRIYTRHHSTQHFDFYPNGVKYDKLINWLATDIIAISKIVEDVLVQREGVPVEKVSLINHGFMLNTFAFPDPGKLSHIRVKYNPEKQYPVVGVISRYIELKGLQYIIPAFKQLLIKYPDAKLVLAGAVGAYKTKVKELLQSLPKQSYIEIPFEEDISSLYHIFDIYIHVPIDKYIEAFGQTYVESLAAGVPSIFTLSGVANDFIVHRQNAWVVPYKNSEAILEGMLEILANKELTVLLSNKGKIDVYQRFTLDKMLEKLKYLYD
jgi:glycosyltransferase involved in cell wall biosynthesis